MGVCDNGVPGKWELLARCHTRIQALDQKIKHIIKTLPHTCFHTQEILLLHAEDILLVRDTSENHIERHFLVLFFVVVKKVWKCLTINSM